MKIIMSILKKRLNRDLYEKQRVIDNFVIEHDQDRKDLLGYFENFAHKSVPNKFSHLILDSKLQLYKLKLSLSAGMFSAA